jgi:hypothetical protein
VEGSPKIARLLNKKGGQDMTLGIAVEKVCAIISHLRAFDSGINVDDPDSIASDPDDLIEEGELETRLTQPHADPAHDELVAVIDGLNLEEQINLVALLWIGRGDYSTTEWDEALALARERHTEHTAEYLIGIPIAGDHIDTGLNELGFSCEE